MGGSPSRKYWNNERGTLSHFFGWCAKKKYISGNPVEQIASLRLNKSRSSADILSVDQVEAIMEYAENYPKPSKRYPENRRGMLVPYLGMAIFAGVRPDYNDGEICKMVPEHHIDADNGTIRITADIAKTHEFRKIALQPNFALWLQKAAFMSRR